MKVVNLYDLKQMGNKGGCTIQLIHHFPFGMGLGHLKKDYIEFKRVGIFDGKAVEVTLREPYSRDLGNKGGCTIQLIHHFPFGMGLGHLKKDYIEFKRVGIFDGKAVEVTLREPYSRDLLQVVKSIKQRQKLIAYRYKEGKLLFVKKEASDVL
ncbi:Tn5253 bacteriocine putative [Streptococcus pneumoniae]|nr:Tn5253 bacteriocine putative [Streptococcus pneumoniae]